MNIKWIKICVDIFDDEKILLIESLPEADSIIVIWFKLLCLAGKQNNSGVFVMNNGIPYTDKMLATIFRRKEATINLALQTFEEFGMVEIVNNAVTIPNWGKHQSLDKIEGRNAYMRSYMQDYRQKQKALTEGKNECKVNSKVNSKLNVNSLEEDKDIERDKEGDIEGEYIECSATQNTKPIRHKHGEYKNVLLSDEELEKLKTEFPDDWQSRIENLSEYMASSGKSYKNHLATIRKWAKADAEKQTEKKSKNKFVNYTDSNKTTLTADQIIADMLGEA